MFQLPDWPPTTTPCCQAVQEPSGIEYPQRLYRMPSKICLLVLNKTGRHNCAIALTFFCLFVPVSLGEFSEMLCQTFKRELTTEIGVLDAKLHGRWSSHLNGTFETGPPKKNPCGKLCLTLVIVRNNSCQHKADDKQFILAQRTHATQRKGCPLNCLLKLPSFW